MEIVATKFIQEQIKYEHLGEPNSWKDNDSSCRTYLS